MTRRGDVPKVMQSATMAVVAPSRSKQWLGTKVWPPPSLRQPTPPPVVDETWEAVKEGVFGQRGSRDYAGPVDKLYEAETRLTEIDRFMVGEQKLMEKAHRREEKLRERELARIARARLVVEEKRRKREQGLSRQSLAASYEAFKEERLRAHFWGHAHGHHGAELKALKGGSQVLSVCASIMDTQYRPLQLPFVVDVRF